MSVSIRSFFLYFLICFQFSTGWLNVHNLMILQGCLQTLGSLCCIFLLKQREPDGAVIACTTSQPIKVQDHDSWNELTSQETELVSANENTCLTSSNQVKITEKTDQSQPHIYGWEIIKVLDFWLLMETFVVGCAVAYVVVTNTGSYLRSLGEEQHLHKITTSAPWLFLTTKIFVGIISDMCIEKIPRIAFCIGISLINVHIYLMFAFYADRVEVMYFVTYFSFSSLGVFYVTGPVLVAEYFGVKQFAINYGSMLLFQGCVTLLLQFIYGILYDVNITDVSTQTCYGIYCFSVTSWMLCALSVVTFVTSVTLCVRRRKIIT